MPPPPYSVVLGFLAARLRGAGFLCGSSTGRQPEASSTFACSSLASTVPPLFVSSIGYAEGVSPVSSTNSLALLTANAISHSTLQATMLFCHRL